MSHRLAALLISALCAGLFLRGALAPGRTLVPFAPELFAVQRVEARAEGRMPELADLEGNLGTGDKYHQTLVLDRILGDRLGRGEFPRWTRAIGGGIHFTPHLAQSYHPLAWTNALLPAIDAYAWWFVGLSAVFGLGCFGFLRRLGVPPAAAMVGVIAACLGFWTQARVQHLMHLTSAVPAFWILGLIHDLFRAPARPGASLWRAACLAAAVGLSWLGAFHQHSVHLTWLAGAWALALAWGSRGERTAAERPLRALSWTLAAVAVGGLAAAPQALTSWLAAAASSRGLHTAESLATLSLEWDHALHLLWPDLLHWPRDTLLTGRDGDPAQCRALAPLVLIRDPQQSLTNWTESAFGIGASGTMLAALGLGAGASRALRWGLLAVVVFCLGVATATWPFLSAARALPLFAVSDVKRTIFLVALALPVAAAAGAGRLARGAVSARAVAPWALIGLGSAVAGVVVASVDESTFLEAIAWLYAEGDAAAAETRLAEARAVMLPSEAALNQGRISHTFFATGVALVVGSALLRWGGPKDGLVRIAGFGALMAAELIWVGRGAFTHVERERVVRPPALLGPVLDATRDAHAEGRPAPRMITLARPRRESPLDYLPPNLPAFFGVEDCATYNPLPPRRMEDFFLAIEPSDPARPPVARRGSGVGFLRLPRSLDHPLLDVFGVRYVLTFRNLGRPGLRAVDSTAASRPFRLYERTTALPRATWVREASVVDGPAAALAAISSPDRSPLSCVLEVPEGAVPAQPLAASSDDTAAEVRLAMLEDERVVVDVEAPRDGYVRLADPWDPGWTATLDGEPCDVYIADLHLRAVRVPAGRHRIEFRFDGPSVTWPPRLGIIAWILIAVGWIAARLRSRRAALALEAPR